MSDNNNKQLYPPASEEVAKLLGLKRDTPPAPLESPLHMVVPEHTVHAEVVHTQDTHGHSTPVESAHESAAHASTSQPTKVKAVAGVFLALLPYVAVFAVGVLAYYFFFTNPDSLPQITRKPDPKEVQAKVKQEAIANAKKVQEKEYTAWISQFYFAVSDPSVTNPDTVGANKLTNFENFLLNLNPKMFSALDSSKSDAQVLLEGNNPKTGQHLTDTERDIIAKYFDTEAIATRAGIAVAATPPPPAGQVAGTGIQIRGAPRTVTNTPSSQTQPTPPAALPAPSQANNNDCADNKYKINTNIPGRLEVPSIGVNVPIIWTKDAKNFDTDLKTGIVHYPCTPLPGDVGTSYISGHSSNYAWVRADFNRVFAKMNELQDGASFKITVVNDQGKDVRLHYTVEHKLEFKVDDQAQFTNYAYSRVALSTCWPINTTERRLVAFGRLSYVD